LFVSICIKLQNQRKHHKSTNGQETRKGYLTKVMNEWKNKKKIKPLNHKEEEKKMEA